MFDRTGPPSSATGTLLILRAFRLVEWYNLAMAATLPNLNSMLEPVAACLTPDVARRITEERLDDDDTVQRLEELREKANEGTLTDDEKSEYEGFVEGQDIIALLKLKAQLVLSSQGT